MKIGLSLSGGGIRATVFHLGVLTRLAEDDLLEKVTFISTVSGGSLCVGLIYSFNQYSWPSSQAFKTKILPQLRNLLTQSDLQKQFTWKTFSRPWTLLQTRAGTFAKLIEEVWGIQMNLSQIPDHPRWIINSTSHETGKNWRFMSKRMGDYQFGWVLRPELPLSQALAASAALPIMVGPFILNTRKYDWIDFVGDRHEPKVPPYSKVHLWDGALYDNLGMEALCKIGTDSKLREGVEFLIISDASISIEMQQLRNIFSIKRSVHDIPASQVAALRARIFVDLLNQKSFAGRYLKIGNTHDKILKQSGLYDEKQISEIYRHPMHLDEVKLASGLPLSVKRLSKEEFDRLIHHGFEVADCTFHGYGSDQFALRGYNS